MSKQALNAVYETYVALLHAEQDHAKAMDTLMSRLKGRRDPEVMQGLAMIIIADIKDASYRVTFTKGMCNIRFEKANGERHERATWRWKKFIAPYLPAIKAGNTAPNKDAIAALATRLKAKYNKREIAKIIAILQS